MGRTTSRIINNIILMDEEGFYVYGLFDPAEGFPFYIGKGSGIRMKQHFRPSMKGHNPYKDNKITKIRREGREPYAEKLYDNLTEEKAYMREWALINVHYPKLTNLKCSYGEGVGSGKQHPMYGETRNFGEEWRKNMSDAHKGKTLSEEHKTKISEGNKGKSFEHTEESKQRISNTLKGSSWGVERKRKYRKIKKEQYEEIRRLCNESELYQYEIAEKFGVDQSTISNIKNYKEPYSE